MIWITAIPLVFALVEAAIIGWALMERSRYKAQLETVKLEDIEERSRLASDLSIVANNRNALQADLKLCRIEVEAQEATFARLEQEAALLRQQLDESSHLIEVLQAQVDHLNEPPKRRSTNHRAKQTGQGTHEQGL